jgi:hypothetical protein
MKRKEKLTATFHFDSNSFLSLSGTTAEPLRIEIILAGSNVDIMLLRSVFVE